MAQTGSDVEVASGGRSYDSYLVVPAGTAPKPAVILLHSNRGLEQGYREFSDRLAAEGYVTLALGWQSNGNRPSDATVAQLVRDSIEFLSVRRDVDSG